MINKSICILPLYIEISINTAFNIFYAVLLIKLTDL